MKHATDLVEYRGPDGSGFALFDTCSPTPLAVACRDKLPSGEEMRVVTLAFGHRRLAILDLSDAGHQPMSSADGALWITYNGEIYNYLELRSELESIGYSFRSQSDTEVILAAYDAWGTESVRRFNGMWAFAIADLKRRKLFCSRDRFGIKPFHYFYDGRTFVFSSEIKQLLRFPSISSQINERAVYEFLAFQAVEYDEETFFARIFKLLHGHNLILDLRDGSLTKTAYYSPELTVGGNGTSSGAVSEFKSLLTDSVRLRLRSDVEVGSCLSGGLDSSSIVCTIHRLLGENQRTNIQRTFSSHFDEREANELEYMEEVIRATKVNAAFIRPTPNELLRDLDRIIWHQEEPFGSTSIFAQWSVFKLTARHGVKVMLDGQGADEQLAGYSGLADYFLRELREKNQHAKYAWEAWRNHCLQGTAISAATRFTTGLLRKLARHCGAGVNGLSTDWINASLAQRYQSQSHYLDNQLRRPFGESEHLNNVLYQLTFFNNLQSLLKYEDRNAMAFSIESRVPFLDFRLVDFVFGLPSQLKIRGGYSKRILRDAMEGVIPEKIRWRVDKLGFATPERRWRKSALRSLIEEAITSESLRPYLRSSDALRYYDYVNKNELEDSAPWRWLSLALWIKTYDLGY